jgi:hypothetical protein
MCCPATPRRVNWPPGWPRNVGGSRCPRRGRMTHVLPQRVTRPRRLSQRILLDVLLSSARPSCCHDLCLLLGTAPSPGEPTGAASTHATGYG